jgi:uncharacterized protein (TIGR03067 family)
MAFSPDGLRLTVVDSNGIYHWTYDPAQFRQAKPATASERLALLSSKEQKLEELPQLTLGQGSTGFQDAPPVISPNGRWIAPASGKMRLYDAAALDVMESIMPLRVLKNPDRESKETNAIAISPDGRQLAAASGDEHAVDLWDVETGKHLGAWKNELVYEPIGGIGTTLSFSADSKLLAVTGYINSRGAVAVLDTTRGQPVFKVEYSDEVYKRVPTPLSEYTTDGAAAFGPGGTTLAWVGPWDNQVMLFDVAKRKPIGQFRDPTRVKANNQRLINDGQVRALAFSSDGQMLAAGYDGVVKLWDAKNGKWLRNFTDPAVEATSARTQRSHNDQVTDVAFLPDGSVASLDGYCMKFWDAKTGTLIKKLDGHFSSLSIAPDGQSFATDEFIWDRTSMRRRVDLERIVENIRDVAFSPDGACIALSSHRGVLLIDGEPFEGLFSTAAIGQQNTRWLGRTLTRLGYLNPEVKLKAAAYRSADVGHIALTLPQGAAKDEIIVASIRDEVGPALAERLGPKIAIHLCTEHFQVERTIEVERPLVSTVTEPPAKAPAEPPAAPLPDAAPSPSPTSPKANDLQGAWRVESMIVNGKPGKFDPSTVYRYDNERLAVETSGAPSADFTCIFDTSTTPRRFDLVLHRPEGDAVARIIYKIEGDLLTICYGPLGTPHPSDFACATGSQRTLIVFRRSRDGL